MEKETSLHLNTKPETMNTTNYLIQIPEPCHEDWNNMKPEPKGKFCTSCSKTVIDFSNKTDTEIREILVSYKDQKVCGHFKSTQLNRPLNLHIDLNTLPKNISSTKAFALAVFLVFGTFLFSCTHVDGQVISSIELTQEAESYTKGKIKRPHVVREDTVPKIDSTFLVVPEPVMINGGMRIAELPVIEEPPVVEEPWTEPRMMGEIIEIAEVQDTVCATEIIDSVSAKIITDRVEDQINAVQDFLILYPNPNPGECSIKYEVQKRSDVTIELLNDNGALLRTLVRVNGQYEGKYTIPVSLPELPNGVYIVQMIHNGKQYSKKLIMEK